jgi:glycosyltransferase involved in cell wall biosynthesis
MRIVTVSAHYPPNFVSGGTLVPQRLARALRARGHDVAVYAGYLDSFRPPLQTWTERDETGMPIRWIVSTPWIDWASRSNFDNPAVAIDFATFLAERRPEIVHLHSLQSLGAGLLPVARSAGARVVVTMHDFWWFCGRQFLVTKDARPCCLVVDAGTCPCEVDRDWLLERDAWLRTQLAAADLVLAPSASAARVLLANGVDPNRLAVEENGLPEPPAASKPREKSVDGILRLLFAGGPNPMKGWPVLRRALERLGAAGWRLDAYGLEPADVGLPGLPVRALPPYPPAELTRVLSSADVLVLPSVMRESHSLLTREALGAGLAVVCSDVLGPSEAVDDGRNGFVVPPDDDLVLADALRRLVRDPGLVAKMQGQPPQAPVRSLPEQVDALERRYVDLLSRQRVTSPPSAVRTVLFIVGIEGAPLRYRARLAAEGLRLVGVDSEVRHYRDPDLPRLVSTADAVVCYRVPATARILALTAAVRARPVPVPLLFDVDDLIFDDQVRSDVRGIAALPAAEVELWWQGVRRYRTTMEQCDTYVGSTAALCRHAAEVTGMPARRWENGVGAVLAQASDAALGRDRRPGPPRIGYFSGTNTHDHDWAWVEPAVVEVLCRHPDVELWLGGHLSPSAALESVAPQVHRLPFLPWLELPDRLRDLDVNLAPLEPGSRFNEAKSAIKWLEAALVATPTVASPTEPFRDAVEDGRTGLLAGSSAAWVDALDALLTDEPQRRRLGEAARQEALLRWSPHLQGRCYLQILNEARRHVAERGHRLPDPTWTEFLDEPPIPLSLEAYPPPTDPVVVPSVTPAPRAPVAPRLARLGRRVVEVWQTEGAGAVGRGTARTAHRLVSRRWHSPLVPTRWSARRPPPSG